MSASSAEIIAQRGKRVCFPCSFCSLLCDAGFCVSWLAHSGGVSAALRQHLTRMWPLPPVRQDRLLKSESSSVAVKRTVYFSCLCAFCLPARALRAEVAQHLW